MSSGKFTNAVKHEKCVCSLSRSTTPLKSDHKNVSPGILSLKFIKIPEMKYCRNYFFRVPFFPHKHRISRHVTTLPIRRGKKPWKGIFESGRKSRISLTENSKEQTKYSKILFERYKYGLDSEGCTGKTRLSITKSCFHGSQRGHYVANDNKKSYQVICLQKKQICFYSS